MFIKICYKKSNHQIIFFWTYNSRSLFAPFAKSEFDPTGFVKYGDLYSLSSVVLVPRETLMQHILLYKDLLLIDISKNKRKQVYNWWVLSR